LPLGEERAARERRIFEVIRQIPRGRVATYGQIAMLAEIPRGHRVVASALKLSDPKARLPWQRVVGKKSRTRAKIAVVELETAARQRELLTEEKVVVDEDGTISLARFGWLPLD
jgi:methylated-DNA-protein-cysteine methyltransferase-like protein